MDDRQFGAVITEVPEEVRDARTGPHAKADVLMAIAEPLTTFLGEEAGGALALQISQLAQSERDCEWELHR